MPYYSELGLYTSPTSTYTGSGIYTPGPYSNHSSILASNFRLPPSSLLKPALPTRSFRVYKPHLATITENQSPLRRINSPKIIIPKISTQRPVKINTADIDVSVNKYRKYKRPQREDPPMAPVIPAKEIKREIKTPSPTTSPRESKMETAETQAEAKPNRIIRRDRATIRIQTIHKDLLSNDLLNATVKSWRDNFTPDELTIQEQEVERKPKKSPGELLKEKFLIKEAEEPKKLVRRASKKYSVQKTPSFHDICTSITDDSIDEELNPGQPVEIQRRQSRQFSHNELEKTPSFHDICTSITDDSIDNELNPGQPIEIQRRQSRQVSTEDILKELKRNSAELSKEIDLLNAELAENGNDTSRGSVRKKKKAAKKRSNENLVLDSEVPGNKSGLQRRPTQKKIKRTSTDSSLSGSEIVDSDTEEAYQKAIRDISQVEIEEVPTKVKPKPVITATVNVEEKVVPTLKAIIDQVEVEESPKPQKSNKFKFNVIVEEIDEKRRPSLVKEELEGGGKVHLPKGKEPLVSNILAKKEQATVGHISEAQIDLKKKTESKVARSRGLEKTETAVKPSESEAQTTKLGDKPQKVCEEPVKKTEATVKKTEVKVDIAAKSNEEAKPEVVEVKLNESEVQKVKVKASEDPAKKSEVTLKKTEIKVEIGANRKEETKPEVVVKLSENEVPKVKIEDKPKKVLEDTPKEIEVALKKTEIKIEIGVKKNEEPKPEVTAKPSEGEAQHVKAAEKITITAEDLTKKIDEKPKKVEEAKMLKPEVSAKKIEEAKSEIAIKQTEDVMKKSEEKSKVIPVESKPKVEEPPKQIVKDTTKKTEDKDKKVEEVEKFKKLSAEDSAKTKTHEEPKATSKPSENETKSKVEENLKAVAKKPAEVPSAKILDKHGKVDEPKSLKPSGSAEKMGEKSKKPAGDNLTIVSKKIAEPEQIQKITNKKVQDLKQSGSDGKIDKTLEKPSVPLKKSSSDPKVEEPKKKPVPNKDKPNLSISRISEESETGSTDDFWAQIGPRDSTFRMPLRSRPEPEEPPSPKPMPSKRSVVNKANKDDPEVEVFMVPFTEPELEPEPEPEPEPKPEKDVFVPLQSNRISQFMHPFKKPEQFEVCPIEIYARPKTIRKRHYPRPRHPALVAPVIPQTTQEEDEDEEDDEDDENGTGTDTSSEDESEEYDVNVVYGSNNNKIGASTSSDDSGFDSAVASSRNKDCDVNCHKKCEKLTANLCGVNQKLIVEAIESVKKGTAETRDSPTSNPAHNPAFALDTGDIPEEFSHSSTYANFQKSGRITPPATTIPRFRKYAVEDFNFLTVLGKGSFGKVLLAELKNTEYYYAIKCLKKDVVLEDDDVECTLIERKVLALGTKHPYLCHLLCTFQTESHLFFVMEYLNGGDLMFHIQTSGRFPEYRAKFYGAEIISGLKFLHGKGIVYRDLKLDNILLDFDGHVRIADFGMCKLQIFLDRMADTFCGTPDYMAPEIIKGLHYNQCVDWWSFGILLYEMLLGQSPFSGCDEDELFWSICNEKPVLPRFLSAEAHSVLLSLLEKDATKRLGNRFCPTGDIHDHVFFKEIDWDKLEARQLEPPFKPNLQHPLDTQYFDKTFTVEKAKLTPTDPNILQSMDQTQFQGFSYTNPNATDK